MMFTATRKTETTDGREYYVVAHGETSHQAEIYAEKAAISVKDNLPMLNAMVRPKAGGEPARIWAIDRSNDTVTLEGETAPRPWSEVEYA